MQAEEKHLEYFRREILARMFRNYRKGEKYFDATVYYGRLGDDGTVLYAEKNVNEFMRTPETKILLMGIIHGTVDKLQPFIVGFYAPAWVVMRDLKTLDKESSVMPVSEQPDAESVVLVDFQTREKRCSYLYVPVSETELKLINHVDWKDKEDIPVEVKISMSDPIFNDFYMGTKMHDRGRI